MTKGQFIPTGLVAVLACLWMTTASAQCAMSEDEITQSPEFERLLQINRQIANEHTLPVTMGYTLSQQTRYIGDSAYRQDMFDCLFVAIETTLGMSDINSGIESRLDQPLQSSIERFREAAFGLTSEEDLRRAGIDPAMDVPSIFAAQASASGVLDRTAVCLGNGLPANCVLSLNTISLNILHDEGRAEGTGAVVLTRPSDDGCDAWTISSKIELSGVLSGQDNTVVQGPVNVVSDVQGFVGAACKPFSRAVPLQGTWTALIDNNVVSGQLIMPGAGGTGAVPFELELGD